MCTRISKAESLESVIVLLGRESILIIMDFYFIFYTFLDIVAYLWMMYDIEYLSMC